MLHESHRLGIEPATCKSPPKRGSTHMMASVYLFINLGRMKGWVGWPIVDVCDMQVSCTDVIVLSTHNGANMLHYSHPFEIECMFELLSIDMFQPSRHEGPDGKHWQHGATVGPWDWTVQTGPRRSHGRDILLCLQLRRKHHHYRSEPTSLSLSWNDNWLVCHVVKMSVAAACSFGC